MKRWQLGFTGIFAMLTCFSSHTANAQSVESLVMPGEVIHGHADLESEWVRFQDGHILEKLPPLPRIELESGRITLIGQDLLVAGERGRPRPPRRQCPPLAGGRDPAAPAGQGGSPPRSARWCRVEPSSGCRPGTVRTTTPSSRRWSPLWPPRSSPAVGRWP